MPRIRTVKPELAAHEGLFDLETETGLPIRFAWCMLFTVADREGRFAWRIRSLKAGVLPLDNIDFGLVLAAMERAGLIVRYEVDGEAYGYIPTWKKHQAINVREAASRIPEPPAFTKHVRARARTDGVTRVLTGINIPTSVRETVFARDGLKCVRCGCANDLTVDHVFPQSMGGTHALPNLRTLCRPCNSSRPVAGQALIDDLARDGLTLTDMPRICMHVHARVETREGTWGKEGKGTEESEASQGEERRVPS